MDRNTSTLNNIFANIIALWYPGSGVFSDGDCLVRLSFLDCVILIIFGIATNPLILAAVYGFRKISYEISLPNPSFLILGSNRLHKKGIDFAPIQIMVIPFAFRITISNATPFRPFYFVSEVAFSCSFSLIKKVPLKCRALKHRIVRNRSLDGIHLGDFVRR